MAKRKARVVWINKHCIPDANCTWNTAVHGDSHDFKLSEIKAGYVRFVESPPRKKARKKK